MKMDYWSNDIDTGREGRKATKGLSLKKDRVNKIAVIICVSSIQ